MQYSLGGRRGDRVMYSRTRGHARRGRGRTMRRAPRLPLEDYRVEGEDWQRWGLP
ncbi:MAG: hypothetical protein HY727_06485 [Candidatus Rokubacteria bacterium]|nr:hypothetical protein [Candidatus Rokubacteria bacterium]